MATPTAVNDQITDSVTQANVQVVSEAPATAMANLYQTTSHAMAIAFQNAVSTQQKQNSAAESALLLDITALFENQKPQKK